jgi:hypothetical protein
MTDTLQLGTFIAVLLAFVVCGCNKDVLSQIDTLLALRSVGPQDRDALQAWVEYQEPALDISRTREEHSARCLSDW